MPWEHAKVAVRAVLAACAAVLLASPAQAALLAHESFETEALGAFDGTANQNWTLGAASETIENKNLSYSGGGITVGSGTRVLKISNLAAYTSPVAHFDFATQTGPVYFSFLVQIAANAFFQPWVGYSAAGGTQAHFGSGQVYMDGRGFDKIVGTLAPVSGSGILDTADLGNAIPAPVFVVAKLFKSGAGNYDRLQVVVNPTSATEPVTWNGSLTKDIGVGSLDRFALRYGNSAEGWIDEIRVGTTWAAVVFPLPVSAAPGALFGDLTGLGANPGPQVETVTINNASSVAVDLGPLSVTGADSGLYQVTSGPTRDPIPAGGSADIEVAFTPPPGGGSFQATLEIPTDHPEVAAVTVRLDAIVQAPFFLAVEARGSDLVFTWPSQADKQYDLLSSTGLATPPDTPWPVHIDHAGTTHENIPASGAGTNTLIVPRAPAESARFFALRAEGQSGAGQLVAVHDTSVNPFIMPQGGKEIGDPFPSYWNGVWHVYTLSADLQQVYHLTSTDLVTWAEHAPAMVGSGIATGTVVRHDGKYYLFYTDGGPQTIRLVVSDNPWHFDFGQSRLVASADRVVYQMTKGKFRDCYVFFNDAENRWWMLIEATSDDKVAVGLFTSEDLLTWTQQDPIFKDGSRAHASCPQVFKHDGRWYLTLLDYNTWVYEAGSLHGPWTNAGFYHSTHFTAASRYAEAGDRRLCWGFFTKITTPEQTISDYGGPMGVGRELVFNAAGKLGVRPLPELIAAIRAPAHNAALFDSARTLRGTWDIDAGKREFRCTSDQGGALLLDVPGENPDYYFEAEIALATDDSRVDVVVRTSESLDRGYRIALDAGADRIAILQVAPDGGTFNEKDDPLAGGQTVKMQVFVCDNLLEVFFDDHLSLSTRVLDRSGHRVVIETSGGRATIRNPLLHYFKQGS